MFQRSEKVDLLPKPIKLKVSFGHENSNWIAIVIQARKFKWIYKKFKGNLLKNFQQTCKKICLKKQINFGRTICGSPCISKLPKQGIEHIYRASHGLHYQVLVTITIFRDEVPRILGHWGSRGCGPRGSWTYRICLSAAALRGRIWRLWLILIWGRLASGFLFLATDWTSVMQFQPWYDAIFVKNVFAF